MIGDLGYASILSNHCKGSVLGTPEYMAPEVLEENYTISIDIYSFGMSVLEISTHLSPYYECQGNLYQIYHKVGGRNAAQVRGLAGLAQPHRKQ